MSSLRDHLQAIRDERGGLTPALVVDAASDPEHPLHSRFEWDDTAAAHKWRLDQASQLLRVVKLPNVEGRPNDLRAFMAVKGSESHQSDYIPTEEALSDEFTRRLVLRDMEREWKTLKRRYDHLREFAAMVAADIEGKGA